MESSKRNIKSEKTLTSLEIQFKSFEANFRRKLQFQPTLAWDKNSNTEQAKFNRLKKAKSDFWYFDKTYFPPSSYRQGYAKPGILHKTMLNAITNGEGIHWIAGHRDLAKSVYLIKIRLWQLLFGHNYIGGVFTENITKSRIFIKGYQYLLTDNPRVNSDFEIDIVRSNDDMLSFKSTQSKGISILMPFSEGRSPRGHIITMDRLDFVDFDDIETLKSSFDKTQVEKRWDRMLEAYKSCRKLSSCISISNNLHPKCTFNYLLLQEEKGNQKKYLNLLPFPAWSFNITDKVKYVGSVWKEAYPAKSEAEAKEMHRTTDLYEWSMAQCMPKLRESGIFPIKYYSEYDNLPDDAKGVAYCDQNHSKKGLGDTTAMGALLFSPTNNSFYTYGVKCQSYDNPDELLRDFFDLLSERITLFAMDGNVSQESTWEAHITNWCIINRRPSPAVFFKRYKVDDLIEMVRLVYCSGKIQFEKNFKDSEDGEEFREQLFGFEGKKANKKDDAPDWLISCYFFGMEQGYYNATDINTNNFDVKTIKSKLGF